MASRNGHSVYDLVTNGWNRRVRDVNGKGSLGVNIPREFAEREDVSEGDEVAITESDDKSGVLELHFD